VKAKVKHIAVHLISYHLALAAYTVSTNLDLHQRNIIGGMREFKLGTPGGRSEFIPSWPAKKRAPLDENLNRNKLPDRLSVRI